VRSSFSRLSTHTIGEGVAMDSQTTVVMRSIGLSHNTQSSHVASDEDGGS
jgi:hypothetical protein